MNNIRSFAQLTADLNKRASASREAAAAPAAQSAKSAAEVPAAPEKDPQDKGTTSIPVDPNAAPAKQNTPESKTNGDTTPVTTPPAAKKIEGEEKPPGMTEKIAQVTAGLRALTVKAAAKGGPQQPANNASGAPAASDAVKKPEVAAVMPPNTHSNTDGAKAAEKNETGKDPAQQAAPAIKVDDKGPVPPTPTNETSPMKAASADIDPNFHLKIASLVLESEEGRAFAQHLIERQAGAETAQDIIKAAMVMESRALELAALEAEAAQEADALWKSASESERNEIVRLAALYKEAQAQFTEDYEKLAFAQGADMAAQMGDAGMMADPGADGALPPEADPAAAGQNITEEDIMQALDMMVQNGELDQATAAQILQQLLGGGDAGAAGAGAPPPEAAGAGAPPETEKGGKDKGGEKKKEDEGGEDKEAATKNVIADSLKLAASLLEAK